MKPLLGGISSVNMRAETHAIAGLVSGVVFSAAFKAGYFDFEWWLVLNSLVHYRMKSPPSVGFILPATLVLAGGRFRRRCQYRSSIKVSAGMNPTMGRGSLVNVHLYL